MIKYFVGLSLLAGLLISACSKSTIVGSEILTDDYINASFSDTSTLHFLNVKSDSAKIYPLSSSLFLLGTVDDPVFGKTSTEVYTQIGKLFPLPDLEGAVLDSIVLSIGINEDGFWGDSLANHTVEVFELAESLEAFDSLYSNQSFEKGMLLGTTIFNPILADTVTIIENGDTILLKNMLRIKLDQSFGEMLFQDTSALQNDTLLRDLTNGLVIKSTCQGNAIFGMSNGLYIDEYTNKLLFYYSIGDSLHSKHALTIGGKRSVYYGHDYSGTTVETHLNDPEASDTLIFLSGMQSLHAEFEIPFMEHLEGKIINFAELDFYVADLENNLNYKEINRLFLHNIYENGSTSYIEDLKISFLPNADNYYNGYLAQEELENGLIIKKYRINFTNELKRRINEGDSSTKLSVAPYLSTQRASRSVLFGPKHSTYPAKLKITYTSI